MPLANQLKRIEKPMDRTDRPCPRCLKRPRHSSLTQEGHLLWSGTQGVSPVSPPSVPNVPIVPLLQALRVATHLQTMSQLSTSHWRSHNHHNSKHFPA